MFGYVTINKPELKIKDYDRYRMYYCGVCRAIREKYGLKGQFTLTYDAAFGALLLSALYEPHTDRESCRCIAHPMSKKEFLENKAIDYMADMNMLLSYYKCLDDWQDDRDIFRLAYSSVIRNYVRATAENYRDKAAVIREGVRRIAEYELKGCENIDMPAGVFGNIMRAVLSVSPYELMQGDALDDELYCDDWSQELGNFGYELGKLIYILDAYDDVEEDIKNKKFNPLAARYIDMGAAELRKWVHQLLMMVAADMAKAYERLPIVAESNILRNIIYSGVWTSFYKDKDSVRKGSR